MRARQAAAVLIRQVRFVYIAGSGISGLVKALPLPVWPAGLAWLRGLVVVVRALLRLAYWFDAF